MSYRGKNVLVIGGTGFVGGRLAERLLLEDGANVRVTVRDWRKAVWISRTAAELVEADVTDAGSIERAARGCDIVFHCASGPSQSGGYMRTNRDGTANVIAACTAAGVQRLVYVSTVAVHAARPGLKLSSETPLLTTGRDYSDSKVVAERLVEEAQRSGRLATVIVRPTYVWGPRSHVFTIRQMRELSAGVFRYVDDGATVANAVHVDNLVDALRAAGIRPEAIGRRFLITDGADYRWRDLFGAYARHLGIDRRLPSVYSGRFSSRAGARMLAVSEHVLSKMLGPRPLPVRAVRRLVKMSCDALRRRYVDPWELAKYACDGVADIDDARQLLGYQPAMDLKQGLAGTLRWVDDQMGEELGLARVQA